MIVRARWAGRAALIFLCGFFLYFGIEMLLGAYRLRDALAFMVAFFAANLVILISAALLAGFIYRWTTARRRLNPTQALDEDDDPPTGTTG